MHFEFATATRIIFGQGTLHEVGPLAKAMGQRALLVTGRDSRRAQPLVTAMGEQKMEVTSFAVDSEPTLEMVEQGLALAKKEQCDLVISLGGGSAIDAGKAIAALLTNHGTLLDYLEVIGSAKAITKPSAAFIAIPTTAGTGSEVTRNAVLASPEHRVKVSLRSPLMLPRMAVIDPELTHDLPPAITASTGLDALTQLIEPFVCARPNPMTDALCAEGLRRAARSLRVAWKNGHDLVAREDMALASLHGGLALANAGLGAVHGFAGPIGGMFPAPHGAVCAALLPEVMLANWRALLERAPASDALRRYDASARLLTANPGATAEQGIDWVRSLVAELHIPRLRTYGITTAHTAELIKHAAQASSMKANPIILRPEELAHVLESAI
jgi:alcohol dehydrogenase class IV